MESETESKAKSRKEGEGEFVLRFRRPKLIPDETKSHLRAARKELLLAVRSMLDSAIAGMEEGDREKNTRTTRIEVQ